MSSTAITTEGYCAGQSGLLWKKPPLIAPGVVGPRASRRSTWSSRGRSRPSRRRAPCVCQPNAGRVERGDALGVVVGHLEVNDGVHRLLPAVRIRRMARSVPARRWVKRGPTLRATSRGDDDPNPFRAARGPARLGAQRVRRAGRSRHGGARKSDPDRPRLHRRHRRRRSDRRDRSRPARRRRQAGDAERSGARGDGSPACAPGRPRLDAVAGRRDNAGRRQRRAAAARRVRFLAQRARRSPERPQGLRRAEPAPRGRPVRAVPPPADRRPRRRAARRRRSRLGRHRRPPRAGPGVHRRRPAHGDTAGAAVRHGRQPAHRRRARLPRRRAQRGGDGAAREPARGAGALRRRPRPHARDDGRDARLHRRQRRCLARQPRHRQGCVRADAARGAAAPVRRRRDRADGARRARPRLGRGGVAALGLGASQDPVRSRRAAAAWRRAGRRWSAITATASPSCTRSFAITTSSRCRTGSARWRSSRRRRSCSRSRPAPRCVHRASSRRRRPATTSSRRRPRSPRPPSGST